MILRGFLKLLWLTFISLLCINCSRDPTSSIQGYIEGEYIYITAQVPGTLLKFYVTRGQQVKTGDLLFALDPEPELDDVASAKANLAQLNAQLVFDKAQLERYKHLYATDAAEKSAYDMAQRDFDSKTQEISAAIARLTQTNWRLEQKILHAPLDSEVVDTYFRIGENVSVNLPVLSLLAPSYIRVIFYVPETLLSQIKIGETIKFNCDNCKKPTEAIIQYISPQAEYTPPILYSHETRHKLVYLVRAVMPPEIAKQFHPGQPVDVSLHE